jgi:ketosteroid isomerase-like protein
MTSSHDDPTAPFTAFLAAIDAGEHPSKAYEPDAVLVPRPGYPVSGPDLAAANAHFASMADSIRARVRHAYRAGDIALLIVDWTMRGTAPDGTPLELSGTATDVTRRGTDGVWRYVIDNPAGTAE